MNPIKKIGKAAAVSILSLNLLFGNPSVSKEDAVKEAKRYNYMALVKYKGDILLGWERMEDPFIIGDYKVFKSGDRKFFLNRRTIWEDKDNDGAIEEEDAILWNREYQRFRIELYEDSKENDLILINKNKAYYYDCVISDKNIKDCLNNKDITSGNFFYRLREIRKDKNRNLKFEKDEAIWKEREEYEDFFDFRV